MPITTGEQAYNALLADPVAFLSNYLLRVGAQVDATAVAQDFFIYNTEQTYRDGTLQFAIDNGDPGFGDPYGFTTIGIATTGYATLHGAPPDDLPAVLLPRPAERQLLITARLTGCTLAFQDGVQAASGDNGPYIAHIQPAEGQTGEALEQALIGSTFADSEIKTSLYGALDYRSASETDTASAVGVFLPGQSAWTMYFQIIDNIPAPKGIRRVDTKQAKFRY